MRRMPVRTSAVVAAVIILTGCGSLGNDSPPSSSSASSSSSSSAPESTTSSAPDASSPSASDSSGGVTTAGPSESPTEVAAGDSTIASGSGSMSIDGGPKVTLSEASCLTSSTTAAYTATESEGSKSGLLIGKKDGKVSVVVTDGSTVLASEDAAGLQLEPKSAKGSDIAVQGMDGATKKVSFEITC